MALRTLVFSGLIGLAGVLAVAPAAGEDLPGRFSGAPTANAGDADHRVKWSVGGPQIAVNGAPTLGVPRLDASIRLDGRLDEPAWTSAAVAREFVQREPHAGEPAAERTEIFLFYNAHALVIGARLHDSDAARIVGSEYLRDASLDANDSFEVYLDTFRDRRNTFYFQTNAVGARRDALVRNEGESINWEWDGVWDVHCTRDSGGWTLEMIVPFSTLRFRQGSRDGWGANFGRLVARTREESYWAPISRDFGSLGKWRVSAYGLLAGLDAARSEGRFQLKPFASGGVEQDDRHREPDGTAKIGLDAKVAVSSTVVADLTVNTDFAQVEADQQQVNLTRFPLFYPEKREYFLENAGLFQVGERLRPPFEQPSTLLFFSRQVGLTEDGDPVPLIGGARVTGKLGRYDIGAFDLVADAATIENDEGEIQHLPRTNFAALRVKRDVAARSSVGAMVLSKSPAENGPSNQVVAVDASIAPSPTVSILGFAARSFTPDLTGSAHAAGVDLNWETDRVSGVASYADIGDDFNSEMGYLQRTGIRKLRGAFGIQRRPRLLGIRQFFAFDDHTYITDRQGELQSQVNVLGTGAFFNNGSFFVMGWQNLAEGLTEAFEIRDGVEVPIGQYRFNQAVVLFELDRSRTLSGNGLISSGGFYDGTLHSFALGAQYRPTGRLALNLDYSRNIIALPIDGGDSTTNLVVGRASFAFSTRAFLRGLIQFNDDEEEARVNVLLRYTYRPGSDLYVVYDETRGIRGNLPALKTRQLLVKATIYLVPL